MVFGNILSTACSLSQLTAAPPANSPKLRTVVFPYIFFLLNPHNHITDILVLKYLLYHLRKMAGISTLTTLYALPSSFLPWQEFPNFSLYVTLITSPLFHCNQADNSKKTNHSLISPFIAPLLKR